MEKLKLSAVYLLLLLLSVGVTACSDGEDENEENYEYVYGTWYGIKSQNNPVSGTKYQYLTITFNSDKTGNFDCESPVSYATCVFTYSISGSTITCKGAYADTYGTVDDNYILKLKIEGDRLIPINGYKSFILTKDGSVETDGDGNEIIDQKELLVRNWIRTDGQTVICIHNSEKYEEYLLSSPNSNKYYYYGEGEYSYDKRYKKITFGNTTYEILQLDSNKLRIKNDKQSVIEFKVATRNDIPTVHDMKTLLYYFDSWSEVGNGTEYFVFREDGKVYYSKHSNVMVGSMGYAYLGAEGTYSLTGNNLVCNFESVYWEGGDLDKYKNIFPGWTYNKSCTKKYSVEYEDNNIIMITDSNNNKTKFKGGAVTW